MYTYDQPMNTGLTPPPETFEIWDGAAYEPAYHMQWLDSTRLEVWYEDPTGGEGMSWRYLGPDPGLVGTNGHEARAQVGVVGGECGAKIGALHEAKKLL